MPFYMYMLMCLGREIYTARHEGRSGRAGVDIYVDYTSDDVGNDCNLNNEKEKQGGGMRRLQRIRGREDCAQKGLYRIIQIDDWASLVMGTGDVHCRLTRAREA